MEGDIRTIIETQDGSHTILSEHLNVSYHSKYGAVQESRHVFLTHGLLDLSLRQKEIAILEIGFGTGLNALLTYQEAQNRDLRVEYYAAEAYPISVEQAKHLNYHECIGLKDETLLTKFHEQKWGETTYYGKNFSLHKILSRFENLSVQTAYFDLIYYDAFAPSAQPELWETSVLSLMYDALKPGGMFVTYSAKGSVKRNLKALDFLVEKLPGPPGKREMTRAKKP